MFQSRLFFEWFAICYSQSEHSSFTYITRKGTIANPISLILHLCTNVTSNAQRISQQQHWASNRSCIIISAETVQCCGSQVGNTKEKCRIWTLDQWCFSPHFFNCSTAKHTCITSLRAQSGVLSREKPETMQCCGSPGAGGLTFSTTDFSVICTSGFQLWWESTACTCSIILSFHHTCYKPVSWARV